MRAVLFMVLPLAAVAYSARRTLAPPDTWLRLQRPAFPHEKPSRAWLGCGYGEEDKHRPGNHCIEQGQGLAGRRAGHQTCAPPKEGVRGRAIPAAGRTGDHAGVDSRE